MIEQADIVVIGSGALGASTAYHLAAAGQKVALVDQHAIGSQTSPRAAGLSAEVRHSPLMTRIAARGVEKLLRFSAETGEPLDIHQPGSLKIARRPEHAAQLEADVAHGREQGVPIRLVTTAEACRLMPFLEPRGIEAISYNPRDVYLDPAQLPLGYARAAARLGCALLPETRVEEITVAGGAVQGVRTSRGTIRAPVVVDAAGAWLRLVASSTHLRVPIVATRHQLLVTKPIAGVRPEQPITRIIDANVYVRPCDGGLMLGGYEADPLQVALEEMPPGYAIADMPLDEGVLRRLADRVADHFPIFENAEVAILRGGLPTMTPDQEHVVGPLPGVAGLFAIGGCNVGGLSTAPALAEILAAMILGGDVPADVGPLLPRRLFERDYPEDELRALCRDRYAFHYWSEESRAAARA
jgi:glycine/D-amino acid oxidase-like deaminating enzyme